MLPILATFNRKKVATFLVALYAFCVVVPYAALAVVHSADALHCLTQQEAAPYQHPTSTHVHADGSAHQHGSDTGSTQKSDDKGSATCCSQFFMTALAVDTRVVLGVDGIGENIVIPQPHDMGDHPPGRTIRPPIV